MKTLDWDYTALAGAYVNRPDYADAAIDDALALAAPAADAACLDLGAGAGHLTIKLAERGLRVTALEPNPEMRRHGEARTARFGALRWIDGVMEATGLPGASFDLLSYGSSFGVVDRGETLREAARLLRDGGWFVCLFNHRDLDDPLQARIEALIRDRVPGYDYGTRREDQTPVIEASGAFGPVTRLERRILHHVPVADWVAAWRSHATLERQAGPRFHAIVDEIAGLVGAEAAEALLAVPYTTRVWLAQRRDR